MSTLFAPDMFALVDADFASAVGAKVLHYAAVGRGTVAASLAGGGGVAFSVHVLIS